jgi:hypothetical protein
VLSKREQNEREQKAAERLGAHHQKTGSHEDYAGN